MLSAALFAGAVLAAAPGPSLADRVASASRLTLEGEVRDAAGFRWNSGNLTVRFDSGQVGRVLDGGGTVGVVLAGRGVALYEEPDSPGRLVFGWNLTHATALALRSGRMECRLRKAVLLWPGGLPESLVAAERPAAKGAGDLAGVLTSALALWSRTEGWDFPLRRVQEGERPAGRPAPVRAILDGRATFVYSADGPASFRLSAVNETDKPHLQLLRAGEGREVRSGWTLTRETLELHVGAEPSLTISARLWLQPAEAGASGLAALTLTEAREIRQAEIVDPSQGFAAAIVSRTVPPGVRVRQVRDGSGAPLDFVHAHEILLVQMQPGPAEIQVLLDTDLARRPAGHEYFTLRSPGWFPVPEDQEARFAFAWTIHSPDPLRPVTGDGAPGRDEAAAWRVEQAFPLPVRRPVLACGKYVPAEAAAGETPVRAWSYARANPQGEAIARFSAAALAYYATLFGPYPFPALDIVESAPRTGGQSGPGVLLIEGKDPLQLARERRQAGALDFNMTFAHEVAHQWWGQSVSWKNARDEWLFEALAEYSGWLFVRTLKGDLGPLAARQWLVRARTAAGTASIAEADGLGEDVVSRRHRADLIYGKGALLLRRLARETGEEAFLKAVGGFARANAGAEVTAGDFIASVSRATGRDLRPIWEEWVNGVGLPAGAQGE